jgi:BirA family transcriptional regulator, biotin operon repressor / biotin---[acetyl-CoA-carboxylase] ligase
MIRTAISPRFATRTLGFANVRSRRARLGSPETEVVPLLSEPILERILARAGLRAPVRFEEVTGSTNATCKALAREGAPEWTLVAAAHQTAGRGRLDRVWLDAPGTALLFSVLLRPALAPDRAPLIPLLAGVAMAAAAERMGADGVRCKWPNDVILDGSKVAGILAESSMAAGTIEHVVVGVGVNLERPPPGTRAAGALRVGDAELLEAFLRELERRYRPGDGAFPARVVREASERSTTLGNVVRATTLAGAVVEGTAIELDERGGLVLEVDGRRRVGVAFGDVEHLRLAND